jgi:hypothetical protein
MADILTDAEAPAPTGNVAAQASREAGGYSRSGDMLKARMPFMVKGAGYVGNGNEPLRDEVAIATKVHQAALDLRGETQRGYRDRQSVVKGMNQGFLNQFGYLKAALEAPNLYDILGAVATPDVMRSFTAGNLGIGSVG